MSEPTVAIVTRAKGQFFKPLYEAFAKAQPPGWSTLLLWPTQTKSEHPDEAVTPVAPNLEVRSIPGRNLVLSPRWGNAFNPTDELRLALPSGSLWQLLKAATSGR